MASNPIFRTKTPTRPAVLAATIQMPPTPAAAMTVWEMAAMVAMETAVPTATDSNLILSSSF